MTPDVLVVVGVGGMGEAIARRLGPGRAVLLADFNEALLARCAEEMRVEGYLVEAMTVDVASRPSVHELAQRAAQLGPVTQFAHTAGLSPVQAPKEAVLAVDLAGVAYAVDEFAKVIAPGGAGVVIASNAGHQAAHTTPSEVQRLLAQTPTAELLELPFLQTLPDSAAAYSVAKLANQLRMAAASIAWGRRGARINTISPGIISTLMGQAELAGQHGAVMRAMIAASGTGRMGTPHDVAAAVEFLLGPNATFVTGTDVLVDGGMTAAIRSDAVSIPR